MRKKVPWKVKETKVPQVVFGLTKPKNWKVIIPIFGDIPNRQPKVGLKFPTDIAG